MRIFLLLGLLILTSCGRDTWEEAYYHNGDMQMSKVGNK